jgi:AcrR family transcriptional regulator
MLDENVVAILSRRKIVSDTFRRLIPEKKEQIYKVALRLFGRYGYDGLPVDRLCKEAGISKGSFFQYFESKTHLLEFVVLMFDDELMKWFARIRKSDISGRALDRLKYLYREIVSEPELGPSEFEFYKFVVHAAPHSGVTIEGINFRQHLEDYVTEIIVRGQHTGEIRGDMKAEVLGLMVSALIGSMINLTHPDESPVVVPSDEIIMSLVMDGIRV